MKARRGGGGEGGGGGGGGGGGWIFSSREGKEELEWDGDGNWGWIMPLRDIARKIPRCS